MKAKSPWEEKEKDPDLLPFEIQINVSRRERRQSALSYSLWEVSKAWVSFSNPP